MSYGDASIAEQILVYIREGYDYVLETTGVAPKVLYCAPNVHKWAVEAVLLSNLDLDVKCYAPLPKGFIGYARPDGDEFERIDMDDLQGYPGSFKPD